VKVIYNRPTPGYSAFKGYSSLTTEQKEGICNGAGAAGVWYSRFIPNTLYGLDCTDVFDIHDYGYWAGKTLYERDSIDLDLLRNLTIKINAQSNSKILASLRRRRALKYYVAVLYGGKDAYRKNKPHFNRNKPIGEKK